MMVVHPFQGMPAVNLFWCLCLFYLHIKNSYLVPFARRSKSIPAQFAVSEVDTSVIWKSLVGYQELIMAMEYVGRERGYGIYFFAVGTFRDRNHYLRFLDI
jgi:hypothetical protein